MAKNSNRFSYSFIKNDIMFIFLLCIYKKFITLNLFKIDTLNFIMYILAILTWPIKTYIIRLRNLVSLIFIVVLYNFKEKAEKK